MYIKVSFFQNAFPMKIWYHIISTIGKKNMQFFPFACMALVKRGDNGEFHKQIKMQDVS